MSHIFRFHRGDTTGFLNWKPSRRILATELLDVADSTDIVTSAAGSSIPTPLARMFLFKTAFELMSMPKQANLTDQNGIYAGLVSQALDLLELLYSAGGNQELFRFEKWTFTGRDKEFFGTSHPGHQLLNESFRQAATQEPFNGQLEITLIYYKEGKKEILIGGTSPFTFVFTSPNFIRKVREKSFSKIEGLTSNRALFGGQPIPLQLRDPAFIWYLEDLVRSPVRPSATPFIDYVSNTRRIYEHQDINRFSTPSVELQDILFGGDIPLIAAGKHIRQINPKDYQTKINLYSDFKMKLPAGTSYPEDQVRPLFLLSNMDMDGQYTSPNNHWSNKTIVSSLQYPPLTSIEGLFQRDLPGLRNVKYPFLSKFDIFEKSLITLPEYLLNDRKFVTIIEDQNFLLPIKPLYFQFFPLQNLKDYVKVSRVANSQSTEPDIVVEVLIPMDGPTMSERTLSIKQVYKRNPIPGRKEDEGKYTMTAYQGVIGIFPFIRATEPTLRFINNYTIASYEKTNNDQQLSAVKFYKNGSTKPLAAPCTQRSDYKDVNTRANYYQVKESFDLIQLNFAKEGISHGGLIIPEFVEAKNGTEEYVYGIDFGTSNTHIEYSRVENKQAIDTKPFEINEAEKQNMIMTMLNKPVQIKELDGAIRYDDYTWFGTEVDSVKVIAAREFMPFQIGQHKGATTKFPFRTATFETRNFKESNTPQLFAEANIGF